MLLVCLSHFTEVYSRNSSAPLYGVYYLAMMAAPTFMIISGILLGFFYTSKKSSFELIKHDYINRGIFILVIVRLFICSAFILRSHGLFESTKYIFITDVIGVNVIVGSALINKVQPIFRIALGLICMILSWVVIILWEPNNNYFEFLKQVVFGDLENTYFHPLHYVFPLLPWFGLYFIGSYFGERLGYSVLMREKLIVIKCFIKIGFYSATVAVLVKLIFLYLKSHSLWPAPKSFTFFALTSPIQKSPPSVIYFLFYGGLGLLFIGFHLYLEQKKWFLFYLEKTAVIGRASLFIFIIQYYFYYVILYAINLHYSRFWPMYFLFSVFLIFLLARIWDSMKLNRFLTFWAMYKLFNARFQQLRLFCIG